MNAIKLLGAAALKVLAAVALLAPMANTARAAEPGLDSWAKVHEVFSHHAAPTAMSMPAACRSGRGRAMAPSRARTA